MNSLNNRETERLRTTGLMIAYLRDEVPLEEVMQIESLMEEDPLYRLSMESLADALAGDPIRARTHDLLMQEAFPGLLVQAKEAFVKELESPSPGGGTNKGLRPWMGFALAGLLILALTWLWWPATRGPVRLHSAAVTHLVPDGDVAMVAQFVDQCGNNSPGIGRQEQISVSSAMVEHFAGQRFDAAARMLVQLQQQGNLSAGCQAIAGFYLGESYLALNDHPKAQAAFATTAADPAAPVAIRNASYWYLGNLALEAKEYEAAAQHFHLLKKADADPENHIRTLLERQYLDSAQRYLQDLEGS